MPTNRYEWDEKLRYAFLVAWRYITVYGWPRTAYPYKKLKLNRRQMKEIWRQATKDASGESSRDIIYDWKGEKNEQSKKGTQKKGA